MIVALTSGVNPVNLIPWGLTLLSVLVAIYSLVKNGDKDEKKEAKECAIDTTTVIVKMENLQLTMNRISDSMISLSTKLESVDHRLTVVETKLALGVFDPKQIEL